MTPPTFDLPIFIPGQIGASTTLNAEKATATITVSGNPSGTMTFRVNGIETTAAAGGSTTASANNILTALNTAINGVVATTPGGAVVTLTSQVRGPAGNNMSLSVVNAGSGTIAVTAFTGGGVAGTTYLDSVAIGTATNAQSLPEIDAPGIPKVLVKHITHATISAAAATSSTTLLSGIDQNNVVITDCFSILLQNFSIAAGSAPATTFEIGIDSDPDWLTTSANVSASGSIGDAYGHDASYDGAGWALPTRIVGPYGPSANTALKIKFTVDSGNTSALDMGKLMVVIRYWEFNSVIGDQAGGIS